MLDARPRAVPIGVELVGGIQQRGPLPASSDTGAEVARHAIGYAPFHRKIMILHRLRIVHGLIGAMDRAVELQPCRAGVLCAEPVILPLNCAGLAGDRSDSEFAFIGPCALVERISLRSALPYNPKPAPRFAEVRPTKFRFEISLEYG